MPKQRLDPDTIMRMAMAIVEDGGVEALSLSSVAHGLGVGPSALYSHVDGLEGLRRLVAMGAMRNMVAQVRRAAIGVSGLHAMQSVCEAYRDFARDHPGQFRSTMAAPLGAGDEMASAHDEMLDVLALVYQGSGLGDSESISAARQARNAIHGFVSLEASTGSSPGHDDLYGELIEAISRVLDL